MAKIIQRKINQSKQVDILISKNQALHILYHVESLFIVFNDTAIQCQTSAHKYISNESGSRD